MNAMSNYISISNNPFLKIYYDTSCIIGYIIHSRKDENTTIYIDELYRGVRPELKILYIVLKPHVSFKNLAEDSLFQYLSSLNW